ncbi:MAG TPA: DoxX family protein [Pseudonocardiaceae bacterium]|nr:DoxX family protein [Pseudonocardiaceae bacterium]
MDLALWIGQGLLAAIFLLSGGAKISMSKPRLLATGQTGVAPFPLLAIRLVAACELVAVVGLVGPGATGILPALTGFAAVGLAVVMVGAMASHASLREPRAVAVNLVILLVCCFVAVGRLSGR